VTGPWLADECSHWIGAEQRHCKSTDRVRPYLPGPCCPAHTPAAMAGKPEAPSTASPSPRSLPPSPLSNSRVHDARAVASGKRRSHPQAYRAAQAAVAHETT
jgi:hypothetical protein